VDSVGRCRRGGKKRGLTCRCAWGGGGLTVCGGLVGNSFSETQVSGAPKTSGGGLVASAWQEEGMGSFLL